MGPRGEGGWAQTASSSSETNVRTEEKLCQLTRDHEVCHVTASSGIGGPVWTNEIWVVLAFLCRATQTGPVVKPPLRCACVCVRAPSRSLGGCFAMPACAPRPHV